MCGRYTLATDLEEFLSELGLDFPPEVAHPRRYNISPSQPVLGIVADPHPRIEIMEWGFIPGWAKPDRPMKPVINARVESIEEKKPYFRGAFHSARCAVIADGFYEWMKRGKEKHPYRIMLKDQRPFAMAGLWSYLNIGDGTERATCAIITTRPNELMQGIHDRMPAIIDTADIPHWLDPKTRERDLFSLLEPFPADRMKAYEVGRQVNSPGNDNPDCIKGISDEEGGEEE
jgi:putative SOS response-associated peptidase YedK